MRARGACSSPALQHTQGRILRPPRCVHAQGFGTEVMQDMFLGLIFVGAPASIRTG